MCFSAPMRYNLLVLVYSPLFKIGQCWISIELMCNCFHFNFMKKHFYVIFLPFLRKALQLIVKLKCYCNKWCFNEGKKEESLVLFPTVKWNIFLMTGNIAMPLLCQKTRTTTPVCDPVTFWSAGTITNATCYIGI